MTIDNAITIFHGFECNPLFSEKHFKAFDMAIASLEAWEKVRQEINDLFGEPAHYMPNYDAYKIFLEIIDKHLQEVKNDT